MSFLILRRNFSKKLQKICSARQSILDDGDLGFLGEKSQSFENKK